MSNIEKIKAEIKKQADNYQDTYTDYMRDNLLSFIESLEKEQGIVISEKEAINIYKEGVQAGIEMALNGEDIEPMPKIKGWMARDENGDLYVFAKKPERCLGEFKLKDKTLWDDFTGNGSIRLPKEYYPNLRWEDDPIEAELTIHKV